MYKSTQKKLYFFSQSNWVRWILLIKEIGKVDVEVFASPSNVENIF